MAGLEASFTYKSPDYASKLLSRLFSSRDFCDFELCIGDEVFHCHRNVLSSASPYFKTLFSGGLKETNQNQVNIEIIQPNAFKSILNYIYTGSIQLTDANVQDILSAGDFLALDDVVFAASKFLQQQLHPSNCIGIWLYAGAHSCEPLRKASERFIHRHFLQVCQEEEFFSLCKGNLVDLLHSNDLVVENELQVFKAAAQWMLSDAEKWTESVEVLDQIRFPLITEDLLTEAIKDVPDLDLQAALMKYVQESLSSHLGPRDPLICQQPRTAKMYLYIFGGRNDSHHHVGSVQCYDLVRKQWKCTNIIPPLPDDLEIQAVVLKGSIYVVHKRHDKDYFAKDNLVVSRYDFDANEWTSLPGVTAHSHGYIICPFEESLVLFGEVDDSLIADKIEQYIPELGEWTRIGRIPSRRKGVCVVEHQGLFYVIGGIGVFDDSLNLVESINLSSGEWTTLARMSTARFFAGVACINDCLYVFGGANDQNSYLASVEKYCIEEDTWTSMTPMLEARCCASVCVANGVVYVLGGAADGCTGSSVECYDPDKDTWSSLDPMPSGRYDASTVAL